MSWVLNELIKPDYDSQVIAISEEVLERQFYEMFLKQ